MICVISLITQSLTYQIQLYSFASANYGFICNPIQGQLSHISSTLFWPTNLATFANLMAMASPPLITRQRGKQLLPTPSLRPFAKIIAIHSQKVRWQQQHQRKAERKRTSFEEICKLDWVKGKRQRGNENHWNDKFKLTYLILHSARTPTHPRGTGNPSSK